MEPLRDLRPQSASALLSVAEMGAADRAAMAAGVPGTALMEAAGRAVALALRERFPAGRVLIACGPGNNGGDGFVAARHLAAAGWPVRLLLLGDKAKLKGDAAHHAALWEGETASADPDALPRADLVVDALFGAGLDRPLEGRAGALVKALRASGLPSLAVDLPSGLSGDSGQPLGEAVLPAQATVTFHRPKPGHLLQPGAGLCGRLTVADIGIPEGVVETLGVAAWRNGPALWRQALPRREAEGHKYRYGHLMIAGGEMPGAARLAAEAGLRGGAGLVTVAAPQAALPLYAALSPSVILAPSDGVDDLAQRLEDPRLTALVLGPGLGAVWAPAELASLVTIALAGGRRGLVLDADALTAFASAPERLFERLSPEAVLTPHEGEFARLFPDLSGDKLSRARAAAARSGAVVLLKGPDSVVAAPDGRAVITAVDAPHLATAGSGDVLAGLIGALLAQGLTGFAAAAAGAWLHGEAGRRLGPGAISADLPGLLGAALGAAV